MEKKEAFKFTGQDAEYYDHYLGPILFEPYGKYLASQIEVSGLQSVLELASGTGRVTRHIRKALPIGVKFTASDISNDMLTIAKRELNDEEIEFRVEDIQNLSFADNTFDLLICQFGMMFLPDKKKGFEEVYRVLKPCGKFMFFTWDDTLNMPLLKLIFNETIVPHFEGEDTSRFFVPFALHDIYQLESFLTDAGFSTAKAEKVELISGSPSADNVVNAFLRKHMLGKELVAKDPSLLEPVAKEMEEKITAQFGATNLVISLSAFLTMGVK
jgi:SAM-dependent methyltransferase